MRLRCLCGKSHCRGVCNNRVVLSFMGLGVTTRYAQLDGGHVTPEVTIGQTQHMSDTGPIREACEGTGNCGRRRKSGRLTIDATAVLTLTEIGTVGKNGRYT